MLSERDFPVIDTTLKFCDMYLRGNRGLVDLRLSVERDRVVRDWLHDLEAAAKMAQSAVLLANFRDGARGNADEHSPIRLVKD